MISKEFETKKNINGANLHVSVNSASVTQPHYPFGIVAKMIGSKDELHLFDSNIQFKDATEEHVDKLVHSIKVTKCKHAHCNNPTFNHNFVLLNTERNGQCFECIEANMQADADLTVKKTSEQENEKNTEMSKKGYTHRIDAIVRLKSGVAKPIRAFGKSKIGKSDFLAQVKKAGNCVVKVEEFKQQEI